MRSGKKNRVLDPCPVCAGELHHDDDRTKRIGIYDYNEERVYAWMCPYCRATFDKKDNLSYISGVNSTHGKA